MNQLDSRDPTAQEEIGGLITLIQNESLPWFTRRQAAKTLSRIEGSSDRGVPVLLAILQSRTAVNDESEDPRLWAANALALYRSHARSATPALIVVIEAADSPLELRFSALEGVAQIGVANSATVPTLIRWLGKSPSGLEQGQDRDFQRGVCEAIGLIGPNAAIAIPALVRKLSNGDAGLRRSALEALARMGPSALSAAPEVLDCLSDDPVAEVRDAAAKSLGRFGPQVLDDVLPLWNSPNGEVRIRLMVILEELGPQLSRSQLPWETWLNTDDAELRLAVAQAYWKVTPDERTATRILPVLVDSLRLPETGLRRRAMQQLLGLKTFAEPATPRLMELSRSDDAAIRAAATQVLKKLWTLRN